MIDSNKIDRVQSKIKKLIAQVEKEENVEIKFGTCRYNAAEYGTRMTVRSSDTNNKAVVKADEATCKRLGLPANVIGMSFTTGRSRMKIVEIKTRNRKYPVICENVKTNKRYKYSVSHINGFLGKSPVRRSKIKDVLNDYS